MQSLKERTDKRRAMLEQTKKAAESIDQIAVKPFAEPEVVAMTVEFVCVIIAGVLLLANYPNAACALMLGAIYLKLRR